MRRRTAVRRIVSTSLNFRLLVVAAAAGAVVPLMLLSRVGSFTVVTAAYLCVGALHIAYDGLIWKQRAPAVARDLAAYPDAVVGPPLTAGGAAVYP